MAWTRPAGITGWQTPSGVLIVGVMTGFFDTLMILAMLAVVASLGMGLFSLVRGGDFSRRYSNLLMRLRVGFQSLALICFVLAMLSGGR